MKECCNDTKLCHTTKPESLKRQIRQSVNVRRPRPLSTYDLYYYYTKLLVQLTLIIFYVKMLYRLPIKKPIHSISIIIIINITIIIISRHIPIKNQYLGREQSLSLSWHVHRGC